MTLGGGKGRRREERRAFNKGENEVDEKEGKERNRWRASAVYQIDSKEGERKGKGWTGRGGGKGGRGKREKVARERKREVDKEGEKGGEKIGCCTKGNRSDRKQRTTKGRKEKEAFE